MSNKYRKLANQIDSILHMSVSMDAQNQMLEIVFKDSAVGQPPDIPVNTVTTDYHDGLMAKWQEDTVELKKHHEELREDWHRRLLAAQEEADKQTRMRKASVENSNEQFDLREKAESALLDAQIEINELTALLDEKTKPETVIPYDSDATELEKLGDKISTTKSSEIRSIRQNAMVKGLVQTPEEAEKADKAFDKVRMTTFYTDKELKTIDKMPKFSGHSLIKGKWIYIKQPPLSQLAADETPFLNLRPKRSRSGSLNKNEVWQLKRYIKSGRRNKWIMERMGLSSAAVSQCKTGKTYTKVPPEPEVKNKTTTVHVGEGVIDAGHPLK